MKPELETKDPSSLPEWSCPPRPETGWGKVTVRSRCLSPWGNVINVVHVGEGITIVDAESGGGVKLSSVRNSSVPPELRSGHGWYAKGREAWVAVAVFPDEPGWCPSGEPLDERVARSVEKIQSMLPEKWGRLCHRLGDADEVGDPMDLWESTTSVEVSRSPGLGV